jgi:hypothetical protein
MPIQYRLMALGFYATVRKTAGNLRHSSPLSQPFMRYQTRGAPLAERFVRRQSSKIFPIALRGVIL